MRRFFRIICFTSVTLWFGCGTPSSINTCAGNWSKLTQLGAAGGVSEARGVFVDSSCNLYLAGYTTVALDNNTQTGNKDYFVSKYNSTGTLQWLKQLGSSGQDTSAHAVATDSSGNVYVGGETSGALDGNSQTGTYDYFLSKYNSDGTLQWVKQLGASSSISATHGVSVDSSGNVYIAGYTTGALDGNSQSGNDDFFVAKYSATGTLSWLKQMGVSSQYSYANGVAVDSTGYIYVVGNTSGGLNGNTQTGTTDYFVAKYDESGNVVWLKQLGSSGSTSDGNAVSTGSGNIVISGSTTGGLNGNTQTGVTDYYVAQYNSSGTLQWVKQLGSPSQNTYAYGIASDSFGNLTITGSTTGGLDGNSQTGTTDYYIAKYNSVGALLWVTQSGVSGQTCQGNAMSVDSSGNWYVAGYTTAGLDGNTQTGNDDYFTGEYLTTGVIK